MRRKNSYRNSGNSVKRIGYGNVGAYGNCVRGGNITINNVTHVTHVTHVHNTQVNHVPRDWGRPSGKKRWDGKRRGKGDGLGRKPELWRFVASCGLLDQDKFARMSEPEMVAGIADVMRYNTKRAGECIEGLEEGTATIFRGIGKVFKGICDIFS